MRHGSLYPLLILLLLACGRDAPEARPPAPPTNLVAEARDGEVALTWVASAAAVRYDIHRSEGDLAPSLLATTAATHYLDKDVSNGVTYTYAVTAVASNGAASAPSSSQRATPRGEGDLTPPPSPTHLAAWPSADRITLRWEVPAEVAGFNVYRSDSEEGIVSESNRLNAALLPAEGREYTDTTVGAGVSYVYAVTSVRGGGEGPVRESAPSATRARLAQWQTEGLTPVPQRLMDAGGAVLGGKLYLVAGKTEGAYLRSLYAYDPVTNAWETGPDVPLGYPAVEDPAVVGYGGKLYLFGGATAWDRGAVANAAVYDPQENIWTMLPEMPTARSGPTAQALDGKIYVVGGMDEAGTSLATVDVYDVAANLWLEETPPMAVPRDNAVSAVLNDTLYVFGGRTRQAPPYPEDDTLVSVEAYDPVRAEWRFVAPMPTGRRAMNAVVANGRALVMGGERTPAGGTFTANEAYDPVTDSWTRLPDMPEGRHGAAAGRIGEVIYVAAGGITGGDSFTDDVHALYGFGGGDESPPTPGGQGPNVAGWTAVAPAPQRLIEAQGAAYGGRLYVFGGYLSWRPFVTSTQSWAYDPVEDAWTRLKDLPAAWSHAGVAVDGEEGNIYLAGGYLNPNDPTLQRDEIPDGTVEVFRYSVHEDEWFADLPELPEPRGAGGLALLGRNLHFFAGHDPQRNEKADHWVLSLDGGTGWSPRAPLPQPLNHLSAAVLEGKLYSIGGQYGHSEDAVHQSAVYRYDPAEDSWESVASLPHPLSHHAASTFVVNGHIVIVGGEQAHAADVASVLAYDPSSDSWSFLTPLPEARTAGVGGFVGDAIFFSGGGNYSMTTLRGTVQ